MLPFIIELVSTLGPAVAKLVDELTKAGPDLSEEEIKRKWQQVFDELHRQLEETKRQLEETKRQNNWLKVGVSCLFVVLPLGTWKVLQPSQPSEQIIVLEELEKYEKARDAGLQALENYVIQNPNSLYIPQAKALIRSYMKE